MISSTLKHFGSTPPTGAIIHLSVWSTLAASLAHLLDDKRIPCYRPRDDFVRQVIQNSEEQLHEHGRGAGVKQLLALLDIIHVFAAMVHFPPPWAEGLIRQQERVSKKNRISRDGSSTFGLLGCLEGIAVWKRRFTKYRQETNSLPVSKEILVVAKDRTRH